MKVCCNSDVMTHTVLTYLFACMRVTEDPEYDGGSSVVEYLVTMTGDMTGTRDVYRGHDTQCTVASLLPGRLYSFQVKANNKAGVRSTPHSDSVTLRGVCLVYQYANYK